MRKILILGGNVGQIPLIKAAKEEGLYVVLCDWTSTNPGISMSDKHYQVSTMDFEACLNVALKEQVQGVISNSEPVMVNVAKIAESLHLIGSPSKSIEILNSKSKFREFQKRNGYFCPPSYECTCTEELFSHAKSLSFPIIIKPSQSSGSRGIQTFYEHDIFEFEKAFNACQSFSTNKKVTIEEYVEMPSMMNIGGDIFICGNDIIWDGLASCIRFPDLPNVPGGEIWPADLSNPQRDCITFILTEIFHKLNIRHGQYNIEAFFTKDHNLFVIEINARQGGNRIPWLIEKHTGIDMNKLLITTAIGDYSYFDKIKKRNNDKQFITNFVLLPENSGIFKGINIPSELNKKVIDLSLRKSINTKVEVSTNATDALAQICFLFNDRTEQMECSIQLKSLIKAIIKKE